MCSGLSGAKSNAIPILPVREFCANVVVGRVEELSVS